MKQAMLTFGLMLLLVSLAFGQVEWEEHIIQTNYSGPNGVDAGDVDGDGVNEILAASREGGTVDYWTASGDQWVHTTVGNVTDAFDVLVADLNGDNSPDILATSLAGDAIYWFSHDGTSWQQQTLATDVDGPSQLAVADFNNDGLLDVAACLYYAGQVVWFKQQAGGTFDLFFIDFGMQYCNDIDIGDFDGDNDLDVVACSYSSNRVVWYEFDGNGFDGEHVIAEPFSGAWTVDVVDFDNDGDQDVVTAGYTSGVVAWYENNNGAWSQHNIYVTAGCRDAEATDFDLDGDMDLLIAADEPDEVLWIEQDGGSYIPHVLRSDYTTPWRIAIADVDNDGDMDGLGVAYDGDEVTWWEQLGDPVPDPIELELHPITTTIPPAGGTVTFGADLINNTGQVQTGQAWTQVQLPNGQVFGPLVLVGVTLPVGTLQVFNLTQAIPGLAPAGSYLFTGKVGLYNPGLVAAEDSFVFTKAGTVASDRWTDWAASDWNVAHASGEEVEVLLPDDYALSLPHPNPFNSQSTVRIALPVAAELRVELLNTLGQRVALLADGLRPAGEHTVAVNAGDLASGLYLLRASVPGAWSQAQKLLLVR